MSTDQTNISESIEFYWCLFKGLGPQRAPMGTSARTLYYVSDDFSIGKLAAGGNMTKTLVYNVLAMRQRGFIPILHNTSSLHNLAIHFRWKTEQRLGMAVKAYSIY